MTGTLEPDYHLKSNPNYHIKFGIAIECGFQNDSYCLKRLKVKDR